MRFIDEAEIRLAGGHGGPGCVSFRRETFIPRGGPDGGDGGEGGDVRLIATHQLGTLQDFRFKREYKAEAGYHGSGSNKAGKDGKDIVVKIPVGTVVKDAETGEILVDFISEGHEWLACKGGRGGKGNAHFVSSTHQAPKFAQPGLEGENRRVILELKLLADVGIIGFPNAGKSTLISRISAARPKIADYPFTTKAPQLGVVDFEESKGFVVADIPGLIEGAHRGVGLGHRFLKHVERTGIFVHLLDGSQVLEDATGEDSPDESSFDRAVRVLLERYRSIRKELGLFDPALLTKSEIIVVNKLDLIQTDSALIQKLTDGLEKQFIAARQAEQIEFPHSKSQEISPVRPLLISAHTGVGLKELVSWMAREVDKRRLLKKQGPKMAIGAERTGISNPDQSVLSSVATIEETLLPNDPSLIKNRSNQK